MLHISGTAASGGLAVGTVKRINRASSGLTRVVLDPRREKALFEAAVLLAKDELAELEQRASEADKDIFLFQRVMLDDQGLLDEIGQNIRAGAGGAAAVVATLLAQRMQARGWLPANRVLALRAFQVFFLALFFFNVGPASAACLLACYVSAALPGRKWYFRLSKRARFTLTAACGALGLLLVPASAFLMPPITNDVAFAAIFGWCVLPLAFIRCIVSNCRYYKLAARFGL